MPLKISKQEAQTERESQLEGLLNATPDAMLLIDAEGGILMANAQTVNMFGYSQEELIQRSVEVLIPSKYHDQHVENRNAYLKQPEILTAGVEKDLFALHKDGRQIPVEVSLSHYTLSGDNTVVLCAIRNITERKRIERLISVQRDLARLVALKMSDKEVWAECFRAAILVSGLDAGGFYLFDKTARAFNLIYHEGLSADFVQAVVSFAEDTPNGQIVLKGTTTCFTKTDLHVRDYHRIEGLCSLAVIPIHHHGQVLGCLNIASHTYDQIPEQSRIDLETIAAEIGNVIIHQQTEIELEQSHAQLRQTLSAARMGSWRYHIPSKRMTWSPEVADILETDQYEEDLSKIMEYFHPDDRSKAAQGLESAWEQKDVPETEYRILKPSGEILWVTTYGKLEYDANGNPNAISGLIQDITERKRAEEARLETDERYYLLFKNMVQGVVFQDQDGHIIHANPAAERILGLSIDQMMGRASIDPRWHSVHQDGSAFPGEDHPAMVALRTGQPVRNVVMGVFNPEDGTYRWLNINSTPRFSNGNKKPYQTFTTFEDITERTQAELKLRKSEKQLRSLLEVSQAMSASLEMDIVLQKIVENAAGLLQLESGAIYTLEGDKLYLQATTPPLPAELPDELRHANVTDHPHIQAAISSGSTVVLADAASADLSNAEKMIVQARGLRSIMYVPLMISEKAIGVLIVASVNRLKNFGEEELALYSGFSGQAAQTIENVRLYRTQRDHTAELEAQIAERKQAEEALRVTELRNQALIENAPDGIALFNENGRFTFASPSAYRMTGYTPKEIIGQKAHKLIHPEDKERMTAAFINLLQTPSQPVILQYRFKHKEGYYRWIEGTFNNLIADPAIRAVVENFSDITERKQTEETLRESEKKYRDLINGMNDTVWVIDFNTRFLDVNDAAARVLGYSREELLSMKVSDVDEAKRPEEIRQLIASITSDKLQVFETRHRKKDGSEIPVEVSSSLVYYNGETAVMGIARDITERKKFENALVASEKKLKSLVESQTHFLIRVNLNGYYTYWNPRFENEFGWIYNVDDLRKAHVMSAIFPYHHKRIKDAVDQCVASPGEVISVEVDKPARDGSARTTLWEFVCITDEQNHPVEIQCMGIEITERKAAEAALNKSQSLLKEAQRIARIGHMEWNGRNQELICSDEIYEIFGLPYGTVISQEMIGQMMTPGERERLQQLDAAAIQQCGDMEYEFSIRTKDGNIRWLHQTGQVTYDENGVPTRMLAIVQDITERKKAEDVVRESATRLEMAVKGAKAGMWDWNVQTGKLVINPRWAEIVGYSLAELEPISIQTWRDLNQPDDLRRAEAMLEKHFAGETEFYECEVRMKHKNESWVWVITQGKVMEWDEDGKPVRMFGTHLDITKQKHEELYTQAILRLTNLSYETSDMERLMRAMLDEAEALTDSTIGFFHFVDDNQNSINLQAWSTNTLENLCTAEGKGQHYPVDQAGVWADAIRSGEAQIYNDYPSLLHRKGLPQGHAPVSRLITLPIKRNNIVVAALGVGNKPQDYTGQDLEVLKNLAETVFDIIMRKRAEEALRKNEERLRTVADFTYDMEFWVDENKDLLYMSPSCERITGYGREQFLQDPSLLQSIVHPEDRPVFEQHNMEEFNLPETCSLDFRIITSGGAVRWISHTCQAVTGTDGIFHGRRVSHRDVTERRRVLQDLRESEEKYRSLVKSLTNSIFVLDFDGNIIYLNDTAAAEIDSTPQDVIGRNLSEIFPEPFASMQINDIRNVFMVDREFIYEAQNRIKNELRWYRVSLQPLHDESGKVKQVLVNATDIHDLITTQQELQELNQTLEEKVVQRTAEVRDLYENAPTGYHSLDANGSFVMVNQTELGWLGYTREELIGRPFLDLLTPESLEKFKARFSEFIKRGWLNDAEFDLIRKDGSILPVSLSAAAVRDENGRFLMSRSTIFDITERKKAETALLLSRDQLRTMNTALQKASQAKNEFLANMSHELRTPLNGILGMAEILLGEIRGPLNERQRRMVSVIESSGRHLLSLINDVLDLSKVEAGKLELHLEPIAVFDLCNACLSFIKEPAVKKGITLEFEPDPQVVTITADMRRFKQVLINLLSNAVKFTGDNGRVTLKVRRNREQQRVEFSVTDTGIGISSEDLSRLFNPFIQVDSSLTREHEGTGLGLALVHELMQLHGGGVYVESEVGKGSTFTVSIPLQGENNMEHTMQNSEQSDGTASGNVEMQPQALAKVLLAEDTETNIMVVGDYLESLGYALTIAVNGREALEKAKETQPDIILMDIQMPVMDGLEATRQLRADPRFADVPIIALTALAMTGDQERCLEAGATDYISKPVSLKQLREMIERLLNRN